MPIDVQFPGNLGQVATIAKLREVPTSGVDAETVYIAMDVGRTYSFDFGSLLNDDGINVIRPNDRMPLQAGRFIYLVDGFAPGNPGAPGATGPADNTYTTLAALLASDGSRKSARLVPQAGETAPAGNFNYINGAWVRQAADGVQYTPSLVPAPPRQVNRVLDDIPTLPSLGVTEDNTPAANSAKFAEIMDKARELALGTANPPRIRIPRGFYRYDVSPNFAVQGMSLDCEPGAQLLHTGSGRAFICDGGATGGGIGMMKVVGGLVVRGNANTTDGVYQRAVHHSTFDMEIQNVSVAALRTEWAVCNEYWIRVSPVLRPLFSPVPTVGAFLSARNVGERTSRCTFYNPIFEGINGYGIICDSAIINTFLGGTSESNVGGIFVGADGVGNIVDGLDLEFNTTVDVFCQGVYNVFRNLLSDKKSQFGGLLNKVEGGLFNEVVNGGEANSFSHINYSIGGSAFTDGGTLSNRGMIRNATTASIEPDMNKRPVGYQQVGTVGTGSIYGRSDLVDGGDAGDTSFAKQGAGRLYLSTASGRKISIRDSGTSFYGVPEIGRRTLAAAATDAATTQTLVNEIRQYLIDHGQCS